MRTHLYLRDISDLGGTSIGELWNIEMPTQTNKYRLPDPTPTLFGDKIVDLLPTSHNICAESRTEEGEIRKLQRGALRTMSISLKDVKKIVKNTVRGIVVDNDGIKHRCKSDFKSTLDRLKRLEEKVRLDTRGIVIEEPLFEGNKDNMTKSQVLREDYMKKKNISCVEYWKKQDTRCRAGWV